MKGVPFVIERIRKAYLFHDFRFLSSILPGSWSLPAILDFYGSFRWQLVPRFPFPVPRSPLPAPRFSNILWFPTLVKKQTLVPFLRFCCFEVSISSFDVFHGLLVPFLNDLIFTLKLYIPFKEWRYKVLCKPAFNWSWSCNSGVCEWTRKKELKCLQNFVDWLLVE